MDGLTRDHLPGNPLDRLEELERRIAELERFALVGATGAGSKLDADLLDGYHAGDGAGEVLLLDASGHAIPNADASQDAGSSALRWRDLYHSGYQRNVYAAALAMQAIPWETNPLLIHGSRLSTAIYSQDPAGNAAGTLTGTWAGVSGPGAYQTFDGSSFVTWADATTLDPINTPLFSAWVYFTNTASGVEVVASKWGAAGSRTWQLYRSATGYLTFQVSRDGTNAAATLADPSVCAATTWKHVVARYELTNGNLYLFVNGVKATVGSGGTGALHNNASNFVVGALSAGTSPMTGRIGLPWFLAAGGVVTEPSDATILGWYTRTRDAFGV